MNKDILKRTQLFECHKELGAKTVNFAGWEMPIQYSNLIEEHLTVRNKVGIFDVSHMGNFSIEGEDSLRFLQSMVPNNLSKLKSGKAIYTQICNNEGGTLDDLIIYCIDNNKFHMIVNASNIDKDFNWLNKNNSFRDASLKNLSEEYSILAIQGPLAEKTLSKICNENLSEIKSFCLIKSEINNNPSIIARTGYTGEDGFEIISENKYAVDIWNSILEAGNEFEIKPIGLGARDTLRLEAGFPLYGHELDENTSPLEANLDWSVKFQKDEYIGKEKLLDIKNNGKPKILIGLKGVSRAVPREGYKVFDKENEIGIITSGTFSPLYNYPIALAFVSNNKEYNAGDELEVLIRNTKHKVEVVNLPFYKRNRSN